ncbi:MAG: formylglycine-generating enzyme family protein [Cyanobacteria bacterium P01_H01_bin.21]
MDNKLASESSPEKNEKPLDSLDNTAQLSGDSNRVYQNINHSNISDNSVFYKIQNAQILGLNLDILELDKQVQDKEEFIDFLQNSGQITRAEEASLELNALKQKRSQLLEFIRKSQNISTQKNNKKPSKTTSSFEFHQANEQLKLLSHELYKFQLRLEKDLLEIAQNYDCNDFPFNVVKVNKYGKEVCKFNGRSKQVQHPLSKNLTLDMVIIPSGNFLMGPSEIESKLSGEKPKPQKRVSVNAFCMSRFPITRKQWSIVAKFPKIDKDLKSRPSPKGRNDAPATNISWLDAIEFCKRLSCHFGREFRLPTEHEWEYACRAGTNTPFHFGPTLTTELANYDGKYVYRFGPKGKMIGEPVSLGYYNSSNSFGLADMHGNVWEWCLEKYEDMLLKQASKSILPSKNSSILRGGSWMNEPLLCRSASRLIWKADKSSKVMGCRVAYAVDVQE